MQDTELADRFRKLFRGNLRSYGLFDPNAKKKSKQMQTIRDQIPDDLFLKHIQGEIGVGVVPIMDDGMCYWGAIDIDAHGDAKDIDLMALEQSVREKDLPLSVCRSKSGGAHLYLFGAEPLKASTVRFALSNWSEQLGFAGCEVFPKQNSLINDDSTGELQLGNWINLCYFDAFNKDQLRYSIEGGKPVNLEFFLDLAESRKVTGSILVERAENDHKEAPPCVIKMINNGVPSGFRNQSLYNICIYLKQAYPETWRDKAFDLNSKMFDEPLSYSEAKKTVDSVGRRNYRYKCKEEPCKGLCNSSVCVTRKFGITPDEKGELVMGQPPAFDELRKITTDPVKWILKVDETDVILSTSELLDYRRVRQAVADKLTKLIPPMKNDRWQGMLHPLMEQAMVIQAPDDASTAGIIRSKLQDFIQKADLSSDGSEKNDRQVLLSGSPVVQFGVEGSEHQRAVYFRAKDFVDYLKKSRSEELKGSNLWIAMREAGVHHTKLRIGNSGSLQVWYVPIDDENVIDLEEVEIKSDF